MISRLVYNMQKKTPQKKPHRIELKIHFFLLPQTSLGSTVYNNQLLLHILETHINILPFAYFIH